MTRRTSSGGLRRCPDGVLSTLHTAVTFAPVGEVINGEGAPTSSRHAYPNDHDLPGLRRDSQDTAVTPGIPLDVDVMRSWLNNRVREVVRFESADRLLVDKDGGSISRPHERRVLAADIEAGLPWNRL